MTVQVHFDAIPFSVIAFPFPQIIMANPQPHHHLHHHLITCTPTSPPRGSGGDGAMLRQVEFGRQVDTVRRET